MSSQPVALVSGGARRLGKGIIEVLHANGYKILIHCRTSKEEAENLCKDLNKKRSDSAFVLQGDLSVEVQQTCRKIVKEGVSRWGRLDILVNNASAYESQPLQDMSEEHWDRLMSTNLKAPAFLSQAAYEHLKATGGCIINMTDIRGENATKTHLAYTTSKAGLIHLTKALALQLAPEVRVNAVSPGTVGWPKNDDLIHSDAFKKDWLEHTPLKRTGTTDEIGEAVLFLASSRSAFITGHVLVVDGGRSSIL